MGWQQSLGCLNFQVFLAKEPYKTYKIGLVSKKKTVNLGNLTIVAFPYSNVSSALHEILKTRFSSHFVWVNLVVSWLLRFFSHTTISVALEFEPHVSVSTLSFSLARSLSSNSSIISPSIYLFVCLSVGLSTYASVFRVYVSVYVCVCVYAKKISAFLFIYTCTLDWR